ncbi:MAG TPA: phytanoyl-CoA dioxygenase family protein [Thermoanaerobaculia bacterium]|nr:phytanoyl-CoA dioxygenase family protein [Thermoanaerobaculia bacterium]
MLRRFECDGLVTMPCAIPVPEIEAVVAEYERLASQDQPARILERDGRTVRTLYYTRVDNEVLVRLVRHPLLVATAQTLLGGDVYLHQLKFSGKKGLAGEPFGWHQDFTIWHRKDQLPAPRILSAAVFLDDIGVASAPMLFVPGSHHEGMIDLPMNSKLTLYGTDEEPAERLLAERAQRTFRQMTQLAYSGRAYDDIMLELVQRHGIEAGTGLRGTVVFFHGNTLHASGSNLSPFSRRLAILSYNHVDNLSPAGQSERDAILAGRDTRPLKPWGAALVDANSTPR